MRAKYTFFKYTFTKLLLKQDNGVSRQSSQSSNTELSEGPSSEKRKIDFIQEN